MAEYCKNRNEEGNCKLSLQGIQTEATWSFGKLHECPVGNLEDYLGTSYKVRDNLCPSLESPINLDPEGND